MHTAEDTSEEISHTAEELINRASKLGFNVLSITNHDVVFFNNDIKRYAKKKGILLIPGVERRIKGMDVLIINPPKNYKINTFKELEKIKNKNVLIIAPHPYYVLHSLGNKLIEHEHLFDAVEYSHFYLRFFNYSNNKAVKVAKEFKKPIIGNSDTHKLWQFNTTFSHIDADKNINSIFKAIRKNKIKINSKPIPLAEFLETLRSQVFKRKIYKKT